MGVDRYMRSLERATDEQKILMTTTLTEAKDVIRCFRELCDSYLVKPIDLDYVSWNGSTSERQKA
jgi:DNA-binding response OmpR family regulator